MCRTKEITKTMNVKVTNITPSKAKALLSKNTKNRTPKEKHISFLSRAMKLGKWKANGESIVVSEDGTLIDGQHRLLACVKSGVSFPTILVTGVTKDVSSTIDTGRSRTLPDVLKMNGYKNHNVLASYIQMIHLIERGAYSPDATRDKSGLKPSSSECLDFADENSDWLIKDVQLINRVYSRQHMKLMTTKEIGGVLAILKEQAPREEIVKFILYLIGYNVSKGKATDYIYRLLIKNKEDKASLSKRYINALIIKAWNLYCSGNPDVKYVRYNTDKPFPKPIKYNGE